MNRPRGGRFVGLISGTSMDAVDAVVAEMDDHGVPALLARLSYPIPDTLREQLRHLADSADTATVDELGVADIRTGELFAEAALAVIAAAELAPEDIAAIGSHGQTIRHRPDADPPFTIQIGNPQYIAVRTGITTVADFRQQDMAAGGEGAPLAPAFHRALLASPAESRAVVNIGGIANVTFLPKDRGTPVSGFDSGPGNTLMDYWIRRHLKEPWDAEGGWARQGEVCAGLLEIMMAAPYIHAPPPKSTGPEHFSPDWLADTLEQCGATPSPADVQRTLLEFTARHIVDALNTGTDNPDRVLICGGGTHNTLLMERLAALMPQRAVSDTGAFGVDPDWVEAMAFAWLAREALHGRPGNIREVTGAREDVILGGIFPGKYKSQDPIGQ
jgi:anhydro-N-acetylmuramic acid kinase